MSYMMATLATMLCALELDGMQNLVQPRAQLNSKELQLTNTLMDHEPGMNVSACRSPRVWDHLFLQQKLTNVLFLDYQIPQTQGHMYLYDVP